MASIDSDIYVIHNTFLYLHNMKKIPHSITYEQWCIQLRKANGRIYVFSDKGGNKHYSVKYDEIDYLTIPNDAQMYEVDQFKGLSGKIPYKDFQSFVSAKKDNAGAVYFRRNIGYSISYDYDSDDEFELYETDYEPDKDTKSIQLPHV
jgi:hypothetical protein